jgi:LacI family transcriptional regulator
VVTLEEIAALVGVSHSTVSRALAGSPLVNKDTAERIRIVAAEAGYQVNQIARNLKTRSTMAIGLIVPEVSNPFFPRLIQNIADQLRSQGYALHLQLSGASQQDEAASLASLLSNRVDGVLLVTGEQGLVSRDGIAMLQRAKIPVVLMGWVENPPEVDIVTGDDAAGGYALAEHLVALGHQRIAIIGKQPHRGEYDRMHGFVKGLAAHGLTLDEDMFESAQSADEVSEAVNRLIAHTSAPTAVFAYQDSIAIEVYRALAVKGISIPNQMSVVGFDDLYLASVLSPPLTTVGDHIDPLTCQFVDALLRRVRKENLPSTRVIVITPKLIERGSTAPPRSNSEMLVGKRT